MRISDWSSDVCSSDLVADDGTSPADGGAEPIRKGAGVPPRRRPGGPRAVPRLRRLLRPGPAGRPQDAEDRKSVVSGKSVSVRVDLGGRRIIKKKNKQRITDSTERLHQHITQPT